MIYTSIKSWKNSQNKINEIKAISSVYDETREGTHSQIIKLFNAVNKKDIKLVKLVKGYSSGTPMITLYFNSSEDMYYIYNELSKVVGGTPLDYATNQNWNKLALSIYGTVFTTVRLEEN